MLLVLFKISGCGGYGFFNGRRQYLGSRTADGLYIMPAPVKETQRKVMCTLIIPCTLQSDLHGYH